jgi:hypothetical protein
MSGEVYPFDDQTPVPSEVAVCPYCDAPLEVSAYSWTEEGGRWLPDGFMSFCMSEPDVDLDEWDDWWDVHRVMPYVYQLPVDEKIREWMRREVIEGRAPSTNSEVQDA